MIGRTGIGDLAGVAGLVEGGTGAGTGGHEVLIGDASFDDFIVQGIAMRTVIKAVVRALESNVVALLALQSSNIALAVRHRSVN